MNRSFLRSLTALFLSFAGLLVAREGPPIVDYSPKETIVEGDQPLSTSYVLSVTAPNNVVAGSPVTITPMLSILSKPANVTDSVALSYVTFTPATLTFASPNETLTVRVDAVFPVGSSAGAYAYKIITAGWATGTQDGGAFINATVFPTQTATPPTVAISTPADNSTFTYQPAVGPLSIPIRFVSTAQSTAPITAIDADLNGTAITVTSANNGDGSFTSTGTLSLTTPGAYTLRARATNTAGTGEDTTDFTVVVSVPPPTVTITTPSANASYALSSTGTVSVPYAFSSNIAYGTIKTLTATLNGNPVTFAPGGLNTATATGSGTFNLSTAGTYTLTVTTTDSNGGTANATQSFAVTAPVRPPPTITITAPAEGAVFTRITGEGPVSIPFSYTAKAATGTKITSLVGTLSGSTRPISASVSGLNTGTATGKGTLSITTPGTYTITATAAGSNNTTASATVTFKVVEVAPPPPECSVKWLPPLSCGYVQCGGTSVPIKFQLSCDDDDGCKTSSFLSLFTWWLKSDNEIDKPIVIAVSEVYSNGTTSTP